MLPTQPALLTIKIKCRQDICVYTNICIYIYLENWVIYVFQWRKMNEERNMPFGDVLLLCILFTGIPTWIL
jgi:hypothetical protein